MPLLKIKIRLILTLLLREYQLPRYRNDSIIYNFYFNFRLLLCINRKNLFFPVKKRTERLKVARFSTT